jgi:hypothetical protein
MKLHIAKEIQVSYKEENSELAWGQGTSESDQPGWRGPEK